MAISQDGFVEFCEWLLQRFQPVKLTELASRLSPSASAPGKPLCALTFDDGWADTYENAFPVLQRMGLPATVFLPLQFIGTARCFWQDRLTTLTRYLAAQPDGGERLNKVAAQFAWWPTLLPVKVRAEKLRAWLCRRASPEAEQFVQALEQETPDAPPPPVRSFMNWDEVREMQAAGIEFGSHTLDHTLLGCSPPPEAERQLSASRQELSEHLGAPVQAISYPWGSLSPFTHAQARAAGYQIGVTTASAWALPDTDCLLWPRIAVSEAQLGKVPGAAIHPPGFAVHLLRSRWRSAPVTSTLTTLKPLRIGFFIDNLSAWEQAPKFALGGSELQIRWQMEALPRPYFAIELYFTRAPKNGFARDLPGPAFVGGPGICGRYRLLCRRRPDIVHTLFQDSLFRGVPAARLAGVRTIISARRNANYWQRTRHRLALLLINRMVTAWQTNAASVADLLRHDESIADRALEVLPNRLDLQRFRPATPAQRQAARRQLGLQDDDFVAVCVANYRPVKNLPLLIDSAAQVLTRVPHARFLLVGSGDSEDELREMIARHRLQGRVRLEGERAEIEIYLAAADVGCLCSHSEGCSNAVLEYMAAGLATGLSDIPANRALTHDGLFPAGNATALSELLVRLAGEPSTLAAMARRNRVRAESYGAEAFAARVQSHYVRAAGNILRH